MAYTVAYCDQFMDELLDKMGSDYFPLPIKLSRFKSITLQFFRESTNFLEGTQELSDDIVNHTISVPKTLSGGKNFQYMGKKFHQIEYPADYIRLLNIIPYNKLGNDIVLKKVEVKLYKIGNFIINELNPFRQAKGTRVNVYRMDNSVLIDTDQSFDYADFTYVREPVFGTVNNPEGLICDIMNKVVVDKLMHKTVVSLRKTSSDEDADSMDQYVERQGQKAQ